MNGHYVHLLSNHFPIILSLVGFIVLTVGLLHHQKTVKQVALWILLMAAVTGIPAYVSGEEAEHAVEEYAGVSESAIEEHEEIAEKFVYVSDIMGIAALIALLLLSKDHKLSVWANRVVWLLTLSLIIGLFFVNQTGGKIRRPELRSNEIEQSTDH